MKPWRVKLRRIQRTTYTVEVEAATLDAAVDEAVSLQKFRSGDTCDEVYEPDDVEVLDVEKMGSSKEGE